VKLFCHWQSILKGPCRAADMFFNTSSPWRYTTEQGRIYSQQGPVQKKNVGPSTGAADPIFPEENGDLF